MDSLSGNVSALEVAFFDGFRNVGEVHRLAIACQNDVDFIADVFRIDGWSLGQAPDVFEIG